MRAAGALPPRFVINIVVLASCQAFFFMANSITISTSALVGLQYTPTPALATLPLGLQFLATMASTIPASFFMRAFGRRAGFMLGGIFCLISGLLTALAILWADFLLFAFSSALYGIFAAFAHYYRFAAADAAQLLPAEQWARWSARAVSWVFAGGLVAGALGPEIARLTRDLLPPYAFLGSFLAIAALGLSTLLVLPLLNIPPEQRDPASEHGRRLRRILAQPDAILAMLAGILGYVTMNLLMTATPLAMLACGHSFAATSRVIQAHVIGMFLPSFWTGSLIARYGARPVILTGALLMLLCVAVALSGVEIAQFAIALFVLGVGWNFMFIGGTTLLTYCLRPEEKAKGQGFNDFLLFTMVSLSAISAGALHDLFGWQVLNLLTLPGLLLLVVAIWLHPPSTAMVVGGR